MGYNTVLVIYNDHLSEIAKSGPVGQRIDNAIRSYFTTTPDRRSVDLSFGSGMIVSMAHADDDQIVVVGQNSGQTLDDVERLSPVALQSLKQCLERHGYRVEKGESQSDTEDAAQKGSDPTRAHLWHLLVAVQNMLTGIDVHNNLHPDAGARRANIEGPVVRSLQSACHAVSNYLRKTGTITSAPEAQAIGLSNLSEQNMRKVIDVDPYHMKRFEKALDAIVNAPTFSEGTAIVPLNNPEVWPMKVLSCDGIPSPDPSRLNTRVLKLLDDGRIVIDWVWSGDMFSVDSGVHYYLEMNKPQALDYARKRADLMLATKKSLGIISFSDF